MEASVLAGIGASLNLATSCANHLLTLKVLQLLDEGQGVRLMQCEGASQILFA